MHCWLFSAVSLYRAPVSASLSSVLGSSNSPMRQTHLSSHFTEDDTEAQREESPARGHRAGTWRKSARDWSLPRQHCPCHSLPRMEATPAPSASPNRTCPPLYKALVPRRLYINPFLPALTRPICGWDRQGVGGAVGVGILVFQLMKYFIQNPFSDASWGPGPVQGNSGPPEEKSEPA